MSDPAAVACLTIIGIILLAGILAPILPLSDPETVNVADKLLTPDAYHWLGTDALGRDIFSRLIWGIRTTVFTAIVAMLLTCTIGAIYGSFAALLGGRTESLMMRFADIVMSFPSAVLILAIVGMAGPGLLNILFACVIAKWPWYARMMRSIIRSLMTSGYVQFARVCGASYRQIFFGHLLPGVAGEYFVLMTIDTGAVILMISSLSFLGLGVQPPTPEWGMMLSEAKNVLSLYPWQMLPAGCAVLLVVAVFNFLGDSLRDAFDVKHMVRSGGVQ